MPNNNVVSIEKDYYAYDMHEFWCTFFREQRHGLPHSRSEEYLRSLEDKLADHVRTITTNYNNGLVSTSEFISVVAFFNKGEL